jgi:hypothetical protein
MKVHSDPGFQKQTDRTGTGNHDVIDQGTASSDLVVMK